MLPLVRPDVSLPPAVAGPAFLRDGTELWVRPIQQGDRPLLRAFLRREPAEALAHRYFAAIRADRAEETIVAASPPGERLCLVALGERADAVTILGVGEFARTGPSSAEIGFLVAGAFRGRGIATLLLARLARAARAFGILRFEARVGAGNPAMLEVFRASGLPFTRGTADGEVDVLIPLAPEPGPGAIDRLPSAGRAGAPPLRGPPRRPQLG